MFDSVDISYDSVCSSLPHGFLVVDSDNRIRLWNSWMEKYTNVLASNCLGMRLFDVVSISESKKLFLDLARGQNRPYILSAKLHRYFIPIPLNQDDISGFTHMWQEVHIIPVEDHEGFLAITIRDVTSSQVGSQRVKTLKQELESAMNQAQQANKAKSDFLAMISHDIRTPMNGVLGFTELMLTSELTEEQNDYLLSIKSSAKMLITLLNDILDFSKMEVGKMQVLKRPFCPSEVVHESIQLFRLDASDKSVELVENIADDVPKVIVGDPIRLQQILINLISNSVKFTENGSVTVSLKHEYLDESKQYRLSFTVQDTGVGMEKSDLERLFLPYSRLDDVINQKKMGTGLGLVIARKLCQAMGGDIEVDSVRGKGSTFDFNILVDIARSVPQKNADIRELKKNGDGAAKGLSIAFIDDSRTNRKLGKLLLKRLGYDVELFEDGTHLLAALKEKPYDLVFMDIQMPIMDGLEITGHIRQGAVGEKNKDVYICALTGMATREDHENCWKAGMDGFLAKPIQLDQLKAVINDVCELLPD
jgi:signal transduction histidine kinase/CheY-like chemotaxis protein